MDIMNKPNPTVATPQLLRSIGGQLTAAWIFPRSKTQEALLPCDWLPGTSTAAANGCFAGHATSFLSDPERFGLRCWSCHGNADPAQARATFGLYHGDLPSKNAGL